MRLEAPAGEVTFLFTDIEGSTRRWESAPDEMRAALETHDRVTRDVIARWHGYYVKDTGDGVFAAFPTADDGLHAAVELQRTLRQAQWPPSGPLRVRSCLHTGVARPHEGDYHAPAVNRCARTLDATHPGQIVITAATREALSAASDDLQLMELGEHRLKDLIRPTRLYQVLHPSLPSEFPPPRTLESTPNNLPTLASSLVGRDGDVEALLAALSRERIVTLTGAGGVGKTRLALQVAADALERFSDGAWLVELGPLADPALVARTVASVLRLPEAPGRPSLERLEMFAADRELLVVLDNCEHVIDDTARIADRLISVSPGSTVIATSREPLGIDGERVWPVQPLALRGDVVGTGPAIQLFLERAEAAGGVIPGSERDLEHVAAICARLDGLPLAIELAASRTRLLTLKDLEARLDDRFRVLTGGSRTALPRQRTLEATVAWSYDLLDEPGRTLFARLSVFAGSFDGDDAAAVSAAPDLDVIDVHDGVLDLADRSLLVPEMRADRTRYRMLETIRAYGRERLAEQGDAEARRAAHCSWAATRARTAAGALDGPEQGWWLDDTAARLDDYRSAMEYSLAAHEPASGAQIAAHLYRFWYVRAVREGRSWLDRFLPLVDGLTDELAAHVLYADGSLTQVMGEYQRSADLLERAVERYRLLQNERGLAYGLHYLARAQWGLVPLEDVRDRFQEALELFDQVGDPVGRGLTQLFLACYEYLGGDVATGIEIMEECEALMRRLGAPQLVAHGVEVLAWGYTTAGRYDEAVPRLTEATALYAQIGNLACGAHCLDNAGLLLSRLRPRIAATLLAAALRLREEIRVPAPPYEEISYSTAHAEVAARLAPGELAASEADGAALSFQQAITLAHEELADLGSTLAERTV